MALSLPLHGIASKKHSLLKLLNVPSLLHIKPFLQGLRPIKAMWKVLTVLSKMNFMPAGIFPVLKTFWKKLISIRTTLTLLGLIPIKTARPCSFYNRLPLTLTALFWTLNRFLLTSSFICIKMNLDCLPLNTGIPSLFRSQGQIN